MNIEKINQKVFAELGREKQLVEYHNIIYKLIGVVIDYINVAGESLKLSKMEHFNKYCKMLRSTTSGFTACQTCDQQHAHSASLKHAELVYRCYAGLNEIVVPLYDHSGNYIGCMTSGQFFLEENERESFESIAALASQHQLDAEILWESYNQTPILTHVQVEGVIEFLKNTGKFITETHHKLLFMESIDAVDKIEQIKKYIEKNYMKELSLAEIAKKVYMSPGYFCHFFKRHEGISFINFLNIYRNSRAEEMLRFTSMSISEIALMTGFGSVSQFNRTFKNIKGLSPRQFRSMN